MVDTDDGLASGLSMEGQRVEDTGRGQKERRGETRRRRRTREEVEKEGEGREKRERKREKDERKGRRGGGRRRGGKITYSSSTMSKGPRVLRRTTGWDMLRAWGRRWLLGGEEGEPMVNYLSPTEVTNRNLSSGTDSK